MVRFMDFKDKEIINLADGQRLGYLDDIIFDTLENKITGLVMYGKLRFFGLFGREDDIIVDWSCIETIGQDTILVNKGKI